MKQYTYRRAGHHQVTKGTHCKKTLRDVNLNYWWGGWTLRHITSHLRQPDLSLPLKNVNDWNFELNSIDSYRMIFCSDKKRRNSNLLTDGRRSACVFMFERKKWEMTKWAKMIEDVVSSNALLPFHDSLSSSSTSSSWYTINRRTGAEEKATMTMSEFNTCQEGKRSL